MSERSRPPRRKNLSVRIKRPCARAAAKPRLQQNLDASVLKIYQEIANEKYPREVDPEASLGNYVRKNRIEGIFFLNEDQQRCIYGPGKDSYLPSQVSSNFARHSIVPRRTNLQS